MGVQPHGLHRERLRLVLSDPGYHINILVLIAFVGFGVGGNIPIDTTITLEFTLQRMRYLLPLLSIFQPIGVLICGTDSYRSIRARLTSRSRTSSRHVAPLLPASCAAGRATTWGGGICCTRSARLQCLFSSCAFVVFRFQESPKFLVYRGRDEKAVQVLQNVARMNKTTCGLTLEKLEALESGWDSMNSGRPILAGGAKQLKTT